MQVLTNTTKNWVKTPIVLWTIIAMLFMMTGAYVALQANTARAGSLTGVSDTLSTVTTPTDSASAPGVTVQHQFVFTTETALTTDGGSGTSDVEVRLQFPLDGTEDPFTINAIVAGDVTATSDCSRNFATIGVTLADTNTDTANKDDNIMIELDESGGAGDVPSGCEITLTIDDGPGIDNPAEQGTTGDGIADAWSIDIGIREDGAGSDVDTGTAMVAIIDAVQVSATINETLSYSITNETAGNCTGDTGTPTVVDISGSDVENTVPFGDIASSNQFYVACQTMQVSTNASGGYQLTVDQKTLLENGAGDLIDEGACDGTCDESTGTAWATATNNGFGYTCEDIGGDTDCADAGDSFTEYRLFPCNGGVDADCIEGTPSGGEGSEGVAVVMTSSVASNAADGRIHYKLSVPGTQEAGTYSNILTYIATPTF